MPGTLPPLQMGMIKGQPFAMQEWLRQIRQFLTPTSYQALHQTGNIATTTMLKAPSDAMYQVGIYVITETAAGAGTLTFTFAFTDPVGARTFNVTHDITSTNAGAASFVLLTVSGANIDISSTLGGIVGAPVYSVYISLVRMS